MSLVSDYRRQFDWRDWAAVFGALPELRGNSAATISNPYAPSSSSA